ncbi:MAG: membrane lipoprotein lipid attachment site-containing protein [Clostridia bacterium]|nr:membrane lipoprotein lipid attachment site-containing protein [Clostridia bacterium]
MKKIIITLFVCIALLLTGCQQGQETEPPKNNDPKDKTTQDSDSENQVHANTPLIEPFRYNSLADFKNSLSQKNESELYSELEKQGATSEEINKTKLFVEKLQSQNIIVPHLNGKAIELRNREGSNVSLYISEAYDLPCIFFHPEVSTGENFYIKTTYLPDNIIQMQKNPTASEVIKQLSPNSPNINNLGKQHEKIYNQKIKLRDREVTALVCEYKTDNRNSFKFVYGDLLVEVRCDPKVWDAQWFSALSFGAFDK